MEDGLCEVSQNVLDSINVPQAREENRRKLDEIGGTSYLLSNLGSSAERGMSVEQVERNRRQYGTNAFPESPMTPFYVLVYEALCDTTLLILVAAALVSLVIGIQESPSDGWIEGAAILLAVFLVTMVSSGNNYTKELQFRALEHSAQTDERCSVIRGGVIERVNPKDLVVGDVIILQAGDNIPADAIVLSTNAIKSNESGLTGESDDLKKSADGDCFLLSSCLITEGEEVKALVVGTGLYSQWGKIKSNLVSVASNTPLQEKLEVMAGQIGQIGLGFAIATFIVMVISIWARHHGHDVAGRIIEAFILAVTIVVVAIPEGLPLAVTISLAYSTKKMYQDQCFIRVLAACETMGNTTNICSDKTGTLTENMMTVVEGWFADRAIGQEEFKSIKLSPPIQSLVTQNCCINRQAYLVLHDSEGRVLPRPTIIGSKTEGALLIMAKNWGDNYETVMSEAFSEQRDRIFAFNSMKKRSTAVIHRPDGTVRLLCKGAPEWVLRDCSSYLTKDGKSAAMSDDKRKELNSHILAMARRALRTLCLAHKDFPNVQALPSDWQENPPDNADLTVDCLVGIIDPLRGDVKEAVATAQRAGVMVRMVTGDNIETAKAIARDCGILTSDGCAIEGPEFRALTPAQVDRLLPTLQVVARSSPDDKYLLVSRLNGRALPDGKEEWERYYKSRFGDKVTWEADRDRLLPGYRAEWTATRPGGPQVVGVTGDGTNDAPALKAADVGLAMGITGTKVAQSASDIVILDDKFSSIVRAIMWGRSVYDNIRKFLQFQLTVNVVALFIVFIGAAAGFDPPLNAVMMLWVNLIMDTLGALALGTEPPIPELLDRRPYKATASLVSRPMWRNILCQSAFQLALLLALLFSGADLLGVHPVGWCKEYHIRNKGEADATTWDPYTGNKVANGTVTCLTFRDLCAQHGDGCFESNFNIVKYGLGAEDGSFSFTDMDGYRDECLNCQARDMDHASAIFNTFVFCQLFNEFNSRSLFDDWNIVAGLQRNPIFLAVILITIGMQIFLVEVAGDFVGTAPLEMSVWLKCIGLAALALPVGFVMRFFPMEEEEESFFDNSIPEDYKRQNTLHRNRANSASFRHLLRKSFTSGDRVGEPLLRSMNVGGDEMTAESPMHESRM